jgi:hypothetical protein
MNGTSIRALFESVSTEIFPASEEAITRIRNPTKAGQYVMGVDTTTNTKERTATIFTCEGKECTTEWR